MLEAIASGDRREEIVRAAYEDVVASGRYTYRALVEQVERECGLQPAPRRVSATAALARATDRLSWLAVRWVAEWRPRLLTRWERLGAADRGAAATPAATHVTRIVSLTPNRVERDTRTFKEATSFARNGIESIVVEAVPSVLAVERLPFRLHRPEPMAASAVTAGESAEPAPVRAAWRRLPGPLRARLERVLRVPLTIGALPGP